MVCNPTEAMILEAKVMTITKAGITPWLKTTKLSITVFVARDHHQGDKQFNDVAEERRSPSASSALGLS
jgi:hypothetical protein